MTDGALTLGDAAFRLHPSGALFWPEEGALVVADLHFEKGSSFARHGMLLPPYDTAVTLDLLADVIAFYAPKIVVALGDSFHDRAAPDRLPEPYRERLAALQAGREWIWIAGNHDPDVPEGFGGDVYAEVACGDIVFRHEPALGPQPGEIAGHLHPAARIRMRGRSLRRRCFVTDGARLVLPAFGVYTGGLNVCDRAFTPIVPRHLMAAHLLGRDRVYAVAGSDLHPD
ncbi:ligase-associated DNA damage response endonuclease PdeM [Rhodobium gokarnense]|uniref:DNA ligase-associated metallophosphoesterase n=1 Tax=Rhodobium gokarnense TaxID=364296 RepID=A0ABT3H9L0_9HYPH|nr:ligase-associated DNA damage response endonuclease PdeM [Rhodobium gokarnense]MCW2307087.1 DNA ligase-associated metallophosphoesterase [Rhodobium gokarnense]